MTTFKDHFSPVAGAYARFRPDYPPELFRYLASAAGGHGLAWDCATGNGQAARGLAPYFRRVVATDASAAQVAQAGTEQGIEYRVAPADSSGLEDASVDLVTVAQALHWFDLDAFYTEVQRVLRPGGLLAVWSYGLLQVDDAIDALIVRFHDQVVGPYWSPERRFVGEGLFELSFPFRELETHDFHMELQWTLSDLVGYLGTWSAARAYRETTGKDPLKETAVALAEHWGGQGRARIVRWPIALRVGAAS